MVQANADSTTEAKEESKAEHHGKKYHKDQKAQVIEKNELA